MRYMVLECPVPKEKINELPEPVRIAVRAYLVQVEENPDRYIIPHPMVGLYSKHVERYGGMEWIMELYYERGEEVIQVVWFSYDTRSI